MYRYSNYIYFLQEESTYFGLRVLTNIVPGILGYFEAKKSDKKNRQNS